MTPCTMPIPSRSLDAIMSVSMTWIASATSASFGRWSAFGDLRREVRPRQIPPARWTDVELQPQHRRHQFQCRAACRAALEQASKLAEWNPRAVGKRAEPLLLDPLPNSSPQVVHAVSCHS